MIQCLFYFIKFILHISFRNSRWCTQLLLLFYQPKSLLNRLRWVKMTDLELPTEPLNPQWTSTWISQFLSDIFSIMPPWKSAVEMFSLSFGISSEIWGIIIIPTQPPSQDCCSETKIWGEIGWKFWELKFLRLKCTNLNNRTTWDKLYAVCLL